MAGQPVSLLFSVPARGVARLALRAFARRLQTEVAGGRGFGCLIADDAELRRLNKRFRKQAHATDVLSFPSLDPAGDLGEIAISFDRAQAQASENGHGVVQEICILMLHGVLHLRGMDHELDEGRMARLEARWRKKFELPAGLIERAKAHP